MARLAVLRRAVRYYDVARRRLDTSGRTLEQAYGEMSARYFDDFWSRAASAVGAETEDVGDYFIKIKRDDRWTYVRRHNVMLDSWLSRDLADNKLFMYKIGADYAWQSPRHLVYDYRDIGAARRFMQAGGGQGVVVKPMGLSRGDGVTTRITTGGQLARASRWASSFSRTLMVEDFVEGDNYRLLFLEQELVGVVRREPPSVIGDGQHSIRELVRLENEARLRGQPFLSMIPLTIDLECVLHLERQGVTPASIPARDARVVLKSVINQNASKENHTVSAGFHPSIVELGKKIGSALNLTLFGMDLITTDLGSPLSETGGIITEINIPPGIHYHDLVSDPETRVPVGELVLRAIFSREDRLCRASNDDR